MSLSVEECRKILKNKNLTDEEIQKIRDELYKISCVIVDAYFKEIKKGAEC